MRTQPTTCCALVAILALPACGGNDPTTPDPGIASTLSGIYVVDLSSPNQGYTCQQVRVTLGPTPSWAVAACENERLVRVGSVERKADTVILNLATTPNDSGSVSVHGFRFVDFTGTADRATAHWTGGVCENIHIGNGLAQLCEEGTAVWHR